MEKYTINLISLSGLNKREFLKNNITNTINKNNIYTLFLNPLGKYLFECFISEYDDQFFIELPFQNKQKFIDYLNYKKLRLDIKIKDESQKYYFKYSAEPIKNAIISYKDPRFSNLKYRNILEKTTEKIDTNIKDYLYDKYKYAIPDALDLIQEKSFPLEFHLNKLNCFDFKKGCYTGQEVISRTRSQGEIRKTILKVSFLENIQNLLEKHILLNNKQIFSITSLYNDKAIAIIRTESLNHFKGTMTIDKYKFKVSKPIWL